MCNSQACQQMCFSTAPQSAQLAFDALIQCAVKFCNATDATGRPPRCSGQNDPPNTDPGTCQNCLGDVVSSVLGTGCTNAADCNPTQCQSLVAQCT
jgi:hypothetical protein